MNDPIRILQVVTHMNRGGLETMLMNYYRHIDREKVQFDFLTHRTYDGDYGEEIKELGGIIYHLPKLNPLSIGYLRALNAFFTEHREYKIVHVHQDCMSSIVLEAAKNNAVPVRIAHCHSSSQDKDIKYPIKRFYQTKIPKYATEMMSCGKSAGEWMFRGQHFIILNNAIDTDKYVFSGELRNKTRRELGIQSDEFVIGHVGRFSPPKNHSFIIDVFKKSLTFYPNLKLVLVGDDKGQLANVIKQKVNDMSLNDRVIFTGLQSDVAKYMMAMDVFLFPSLYEGFPVTMVEAQATGLTCIISDRVPLDCKITDLVIQNRLTDSLDKWAVDVVKSCKTEKRTNRKQEIVKSGFDIESNAKWLEGFYRKRFEESFRSTKNDS